MKKLSLLSIVCLAFALSACGKKDAPAEGGEKTAEATKEAAAEKAPEKAAEKAPAKPAAKPMVEIPALGLKAEAPEGTNVSEMLGDQMLQGPGLVVTVAAAGDDYPKDMAAAVKDMQDTYDGVTNVKEEKLADGWVFSAENKGGMGTNYWVKSRRTIGGKDYKCETTASQPEQQANAIKACKSLAAK